MPWGHSSGRPSPGTVVYWQALVQPYAKNRGITLCPSYKRNYGFPDWFSSLDNIDVDLQNKVWYVSYVLNGVYDWAGGTKWKDNNPNAHFGPKSGTSLAQAEEPAGTIYITDAHAPDAWSDNHLDYPCTRFASCNNYSVGKGEGAKTAQARGVHNERIIILWIDGHVTTMRWGDTKPNQWTLQADAAADPFGP
jgi:prepilin-type processing-associated H-X9-DG protein